MTVIDAKDLWAGWPNSVTYHLQRAYGEPVAVEPLGGMSIARVYRVRFPGRSVIVKASPRPAEARFYERIAPRLRQEGVPIPRLERIDHLPDGHWLVLEDISRPLPAPPLERWQPDPRVVAVLAGLHRTTRGWSLDFPESRPWDWTDHITDRALSCFPADVAAALAPLLHTLRREAAYLTSEWCWISGDASPPNWGVRDDGALVLYDWELFRRGLPAADLAPTIPGLPHPEHFRLAAESYLQAWRTMGADLPWSREALARDIALAKAATVVMLLRAHADGLSRVPAGHIARLVEAVPPWLQGFG